MGLRPSRPPSPSQSLPPLCCTAVKGLELYKESMAASDALCCYYATIEQIDEVGWGRMWAALCVCGA